jgi:RNA polymerase sigma factor (sigma-70 family)
LRRDFEDERSAADLHSLSDAELVALANSGDEAQSQGAIMEIYLRNWPIVLKRAQQYLLNNEDAEDVAQIVFRKVLTNLQTFRPSDEQKLRNWLVMITRNACFDYLRLQKRRSEVSLDALSESLSDWEEAGTLREPANPAPSPEESATSDLALYRSLVEQLREQPGREFDAVCASLARLVGLDYASVVQHLLSERPDLLEGHSKKVEALTSRVRGAVLRVDDMFISTLYTGPKRR